MYCLYSQGVEVIDDLVVSTDESSMELDTYCKEGMGEISQVPSQELLPKTTPHSRDAEQAKVRLLQTKYKQRKL